MSEPVPAAAVPPPVPPRRPGNPWAGLALDVLLAVVGILVVSTILVTPLLLLELATLPEAERVRAAADTDLLMQGAMAEITFAALLATLLVALGVWWLRGRGQPRPAPPTSAARAAAWAIAAGVLIQGAVVALFHVLQAFGGDNPAQPSNVEPILALQEASPLLNWLMVVAVAPLAEELLFRRVMLHRFMVAGRGLAGLVATSVLFAATHEVGQGGAHSLLQWLGLMAIYTGMGLGFGVVYLRTGRLSAAFLAHAACNATALAVMAFSAG